MAARSIWPIPPILTRPCADSSPPPSHSIVLRRPPLRSTAGGACASYARVRRMSNTDPWLRVGLTEHETRYLRRWVRFLNGLRSTRPVYEIHWPTITDQRREQIRAFAYTFTTKDY